jgi:uncharacterized protein
MGTGNVDTVKGIYEAFGRGDVSAILETLSDDVQWDAWGDNSAQRAGVPWLLPRSGKAGAAEFFGEVGQMKINEFHVLSLADGGSKVVVEVLIDAEIPHSGGRFRDEELHLWTFNDEGKVIAMRHYTDTAKHIAAARGPGGPAQPAPTA